MKMGFCLAVLSVFTLLATDGYAQEKTPTTGSLYGGDPLPLGQRLACRKDIGKLCNDYAGNGGDIVNDANALKCLHDNSYSLSDSCANVIKENNPDWTNSNTNWNTYVRDNTPALNQNPGTAPTSTPAPASSNEPTKPTISNSDTTSQTYSGNSSAPAMLIKVPQQGNKQ